METPPFPCNEGIHLRCRGCTLRLLRSVPLEGHWGSWISLLRGGPVWRGHRAFKLTRQTRSLLQKEMGARPRRACAAQGPKSPWNPGGHAQVQVGPDAAGGYCPPRDTRRHPTMLSGIRPPPSHARPDRAGSPGRPRRSGASWPYEPAPGGWLCGRAPGHTGQWRISNTERSKWQRTPQGPRLLGGCASGSRLWPSTRPGALKFAGNVRNVPVPDLDRTLQ